MFTKRGVRQAVPVYGGFFLLGFAGWLQDECNAIFHQLTHWAAQSHVPEKDNVTAPPLGYCFGMA
jgi:hypothetical protein